MLRSPAQELYRRAASLVWGRATIISMLLEVLSFYNLLTILCWIIFISFWALESVNVKRNRDESEGWQSNRFALTSTALFSLVVFTFLLRDPILMVSSAIDVVPADSISATLGVILTAGGIALAIWARVHLGRNWSAEPTLKESHHLVTTGPYRFIRHPIYAGELLAIIGSALVGGVIWIVVFFVLIALVSYRIHKEERMLSEEFPEGYRTYAKNTRRFIPFVF